MKTNILGAALTCGLLWSTGAAAGPVIAVDMDPATAGVQSALSIAAGQSFAIDVVLDTDGALLSGFELSLTPGALTGLPIIATQILAYPVFGSDNDDTDVDVLTLDDGGAGVAAAALVQNLGDPANGDALPLIRITYSALLAGVQILDLFDVLLVDPDGLELQFTSSDGLVTVTAPVPLPSALALLGLGLPLLRLSANRANMRHGTPRR